MPAEHISMPADRFPRAWRIRTMRRGVLAAIVCGMLIAACSPYGPAGGGVPFSLRALVDADARHLEEGYRAFYLGQTKTALDHFQDVATRPGIDPELSHAARYALACAQLALARTPEAYAEGHASWLLWWEQRPRGGIGDEDPVLLAPFFLDTLPLLLAPPPPRVVETACPPDTRAETEALRRELQETYAKIQRLEKESRTLRANLGRKELKIQAFEDQIHQFEEQVRGISEQIQALEQIDQRMEEKKKGITPP